MEQNNNFFNRRNEVNIDVSNRCPLECSACSRETYFRTKGLKVPGEDISIERFKKLVKFFRAVRLEGVYSDPIHHRSFIELLKICKDYNKKVSVHHATGAKSKEWYIEAFKANPNAFWNFAIDGLPEESKKYRIHQNGPKLFDIMVESTKYLVNKPIWQYIVFSYNENSIDAAVALAKEVDVRFYLLLSSRWVNNNDWLMPTKPEYRMIKSSEY